MSAGVSEAARRRQYVLFGMILVGMCAFLGLGYFLFLRVDYAVLASGLRPAEASVIVAELDKQGIDYRIGDGGSTIRVPGGEADATRVAIAGSDAAARGQVGFELFNKSDMGLTNFAQKINFQRALQGELIRTIAAMDGVDTARVHLGLPERSLFRGERSEPSAAVTVTMKHGRIPDPARVVGIQRLVAASVPDLPEANVVVLDGQGRVISVARQGQPASDLDERQAIQAYYAARARSAARGILNEDKFSVQVLAQPGVPSGEDAGSDAMGSGSARDFSVRVIFVTSDALDEGRRIAVRDAIARAVHADPARGDSVEFETGPVRTREAAAEPPVVAARVQPHVASAAQTYEEIAPNASPASAWIWLLLPLVIAALVAVGLIRRRPRLTPSEHEAFATRLQRQLALREEVPDAQHG